MHVCTYVHMLHMCMFMYMYTCMYMYMYMYMYMCISYASGSHLTSRLLFQVPSAVELLLVEAVVLIQNLHEVDKA